MKGVWLLPGGSKDVAVKMLKEGSPEEDTVKFLQEAAIHGQFWHPNVVKLMGVVTVGEPVSGLHYFCAFGLCNFVLLELKSLQLLAPYLPSNYSSVQSYHKT